MSFPLQFGSNLSVLSARVAFNRLKALTLVVLGLFAIMTIRGTVASAQLESGQISGTVMDQTGAAVPGAAVSVKNTATNAERDTVSSSTGGYEVTGLTPATYQLTVSAGSFKAFTATVEVTVGGHVTLDAKLSVSAAVTEVQVVGEGGAQVNTQTQEMSQVVDTQQIANLPSLTRNPYDFVALAGNVSGGDNSTNSGATAIDATGSGQNQTDRGVGYSINGQRESGTEILLDGVENVSIFSQALAKTFPWMRPRNSASSPVTIRQSMAAPPGGVINVTTKAGTNSFHGSGWEFNRLSAYTANTYGNDAAKCGISRGRRDRAICPTRKANIPATNSDTQPAAPSRRTSSLSLRARNGHAFAAPPPKAEEIFDPAFIALMPSNIQAYYKTYGQTTLPSAGVASTVGQVAATGINFGPVNGTTPIPASTPMFDTVNFSAPFDAGGGIPQNTYDLVGRVDYNPTDKTQMFFRGGREARSRSPDPTPTAPIPSTTPAPLS